MPRGPNDERDTQSVPKWFADFAERNAKEHGELKSETQDKFGELKSEIAKAETRMTRWTLGAIALAFIDANG